MFGLFAKTTLLALLLVPIGAATQSRIEDHKPAAETPAKDAKNGKPAATSKRTVWNLDGGAFFSTDGHMPNGSCFRLSGQMTAPDFFEGLRRVDATEGTFYTLREKVVTLYPAEVLLTLHILDFPCTLDLKDTVVRPPLTRELMSTLRLNFFWKDGIALKPVQLSKRTAASVRRLQPYASNASEELAPRFEWNYDFAIGSEGIPLTHNLVIVIENQDRKIAARVAAHL
jgi:hypothetical protein